MDDPESEGFVKVGIDKDQGEPYTTEELHILLEWLKRTGRVPRPAKTYPPVDVVTMLRLMATCKPIVEKEPVVLQIHPPLYVCGDIHGQFHDMIRVFDALGYPPGTKDRPVRYLFLGDYVDRGLNSIEVICTLVTLKCLYPNDIFLLRGNHEDEPINRMYGLYDEVKRRMVNGSWLLAYKLMNSLFSYFSLCAKIGTEIFCMHGGIGPDLSRYGFDSLKDLKKPTFVTSSGPVCDLLWADPGYSLNGWRDSSRGCSYEFGSPQLINFLKTQGFSLIARAHQVVQNGYQFFGEKHLVTLFTARDYSEEYDNDGAIMTVDRNELGEIVCGFIVVYSKYRRRPTLRLASGKLVGLSLETESERENELRVCAEPRAQSLTSSKIVPSSKTELGDGKTNDRGDEELYAEQENLIANLNCNNSRDGEPTEQTADATEATGGYGTSGGNCD